MLSIPEFRDILASLNPGIFIPEFRDTNFLNK